MDNFIEEIEKNAVMTQEDKKQKCKKCGRVFGSVKCFDVDCPYNTPKITMTQEDNLTLQEKIESVMSMLNTPIFKRRIGNEEITKLIMEICQEMGIKGGI